MTLAVTDHSKAASKDQVKTGHLRFGDMVPAEQADVKGHSEPPLPAGRTPDSREGRLPSPTTWTAPEPLRLVPLRP